MQRAVVSQCPLTGQEKERYLASFLGSNELEIKMRDGSREGSLTNSPRVSRREELVSGSPRSPRRDIADSPRNGRKTPADATTPKAMVTKPFHRINRSPMTKATSLDSGTDESDGLEELADVVSYHTSPDLSSDENNTYFALAGFPVVKPHLDPPVRSTGRPARFGVPVIMTQPGSTADSKPRLRDVKRALSPQPQGSKTWSPGPDPRRALTPGPDLLTSHYSPYTERSSQAKFSSPVVVNPTKLPPFSKA